MGIEVYFILFIHFIIQVFFMYVKCEISPSHPRVTAESATGVIFAKKGQHRKYGHTGSQSVSQQLHTVCDINADKVYSMWSVSTKVQQIRRYFPVALNQNFPFHCSLAGVR